MVGRGRLEGRAPTISARDRGRGPRRVEDVDSLISASAGAGRTRDGDGATASAGGTGARPAYVPATSASSIPRSASAWWRRRETKVLQEPLGTRPCSAWKRLSAARERA